MPNGWLSWADFRSHLWHTNTRLEHKNKTKVLKCRLSIWISGLSCSHTLSRVLLRKLCCPALKHSKVYTMSEFTNSYWQPNFKWNKSSPKWQSDLHKFSLTCKLQLPLTFPPKAEVNKTNYSDPTFCKYYIVPILDPLCTHTNTNTHRSRHR